MKRYALGTEMPNIGGAFDTTAPAADTLGQALHMMVEGGIFTIGNSIWQIIGLVVSLIIMAMGVAGGIEKANKVMMPTLFLLFIALGIYISFLPGASDGYKYILTLRPAGLLGKYVPEKV